MEKPASRAPMPTFDLCHSNGMGGEKRVPISDHGWVQLSGEGWTIRVRPTNDGRGLEITTQGIHAGATHLVVEPRVSNQVYVYNDAARAELIYEEADQIDRARQADKKSPMGPTRRKKK